MIATGAASISHWLSSPNSYCDWKPLLIAPALYVAGTHMGVALASRKPPPPSAALGANSSGSTPLPWRCICKLRVDRREGIHVETSGDDGAGSIRGGGAIFGRNGFNVVSSW